MLTFLKPPEDFAPIAEAAGCYCEYEDKLLFLKRHPDKSQGNTWGIPGGKLEKGESARDAVIREIWEEVGLDISGEDLQEVGKLYMRLSHCDYVFHMFRKRFTFCPSLILALEEHHEAQWVTFEEALKLPLITGGRDALSFYQMFINP
jgi:8-oxo-dGTP pyrophosphatase MutT (NUDIX family)